MILILMIVALVEIIIGYQKTRIHIVKRCSDRGHVATIIHIFVDVVVAVTDNVMVMSKRFVSS